MTTETHNNPNKLFEDGIITAQESDEMIRLQSATRKPVNAASDIQVPSMSLQGVGGHADTIDNEMSAFERFASYNAGEKMAQLRHNEMVLISRAMSPGATTMCCLDMMTPLNQEWIFNAMTQAGKSAGHERFDETMYLWALCLQLPIESFYGEHTLIPALERKMSELIERDNDYYNQLFLAFTFSGTAELTEDTVFDIATKNYNEILLT